MITKIGIYKDPRNKKRPWVVRWYGEYEPSTGKQRRYSKAFRLKVEAEQFQASKRKEFSEGTIPRDGMPDVTLGNFCKKFLHVSPGYGGSCFHKDTSALVHIGRDVGHELSIVPATIEANRKQKLFA